MIYFDEATHTYTVDGQRLPSVTEICRFLSYDRKSDKPWLAQQAADRGTRIHEACVLLDYGEDPEDDPEIAGYLTAYRRFLHDYKPEWQGIETMLGSKSLGYAGTCDRYGIINGRRVVLDIKTGASVNKVSVASQLDGYASLLWAKRGWCADSLFCLLLRKDGVYVLGEMPKELSAFVVCHRIHLMLSQKGMTIR